MIHGDRQARAAVRSRALLVAGVLLVAFVVSVLASGAASVSFQTPWKAIATLVVAAIVVAFHSVRQR